MPFGWARRALTVGSLLAIAWICVRPAEGEGADYIRTCLMCSDEGVPNILLNILLYVPLGVAVAWHSGSVALAGAVGFALSLAVEVGQIWIPGRFPGVVDLMSNTLGAFGGGAVWWFRTALWAPGPRSRARLAQVWTMIALAAGAAPAYLVTPLQPYEQVYVGWTPVLGSLERYSGRVVSARIAGTPLRPDSAIDPAVIRGMLSGPDELIIDLEVGPAVAGLAPILHLGTESGTELLLVGVAGTSVVVRPRIAARTYRLAAPDHRATRLLDAAQPGDTVRIRIATHSSSHWSISSEGATTVPRVSAARGWSLLRYPHAWPDWAHTAMDLAWIVVLFAPLAFWAPTHGRLLASIASLAAVAVILPVWTILTPPHMLHGVAAALGTGGGLGLRFAASRRAQQSSSP